MSQIWRDAVKGIVISLVLNSRAKFRNRTMFFILIAQGNNEYVRQNNFGFHVGLLIHLKSCHTETSVSIYIDLNPLVERPICVTWYCPFMRPWMNNNTRSPSFPSYSFTFVIILAFYFRKAAICRTPRVIKLRDTRDSTAVQCTRIATLFCHNDINVHEPSEKKCLAY